MELDRAVHPQREQTDESLRSERETADGAAADKLDALDVEADEVVRVARERADEIVEAARKDADRRRTADAQDAGASSRRDQMRAEQLLEAERAEADAVLERERARADAVLAYERTQQRRYMTDFLAVERAATDQDLVGERVDADAAMAGRDDFLAIVSHDLRSMLYGLSLGASRMIKNAPPGAAGDLMRDYGSTSQTVVAQMSRLIGDLLDLTAIEAGHLALFPAPVNVAPLLQETLAAFEPLAASKRIHLQVELVEPPLRANLDAGRILQVLANLVSNAMKFTAVDGQISVRARRHDDELEFTVSDTGIGIPEDALDTVFERFHQVSKDRRGLGLGLHISKGIVEGHGGRIWAESKLGSGSTFHFALPMGVDRAGSGAEKAAR